jgi:hypothetical protein
MLELIDQIDEVEDAPGVGVHIQCGIGWSSSFATVSAAGFGCVECSIRRLNQRLDGKDRIRCEGKAEAGGDGLACRSEIEGCIGDGQAQPVPDLHQLLRVCIANQEQEFLTPITAQKIVRAKLGRQAAGELAQGRVAGTMAIGIIDPLEMSIRPAKTAGW